MLEQLGGLVLLDDPALLDVLALRLQRLKQSRQPLQISNTRWSSDSICAPSQNWGLS